MRTLIAIPCMDMVHTDFMRSAVGMRHRGETQFTFSQASLVYDGRNLLANTAIDGDFDRVLWLDSDMIFEPDLEERLHKDLDRGLDLVSALYFTRKPPLRPVIYSDIALDIVDGQQNPRADSYLDYPTGSVFPIAGCGFGAVMMTTQLLREVRDRYRLPFFPINGFGEDFAFCLRVRELGHTIWCDSSIKLGHAGTAVIDEEHYTKTEEDRA